MKLYTSVFMWCIYVILKFCNCGLMKKKKKKIGEEFVISYAMTEKENKPLLTLLLTYPIAHSTICFRVFISEKLKFLYHVVPYTTSSVNLVVCFCFPLAHSKWQVSFLAFFPRNLDTWTLSTVMHHWHLCYKFHCTQFIGLLIQILLCPNMFGNSL